MRTAFRTNGVAAAMAAGLLAASVGSPSCGPGGPTAPTAEFFRKTNVSGLAVTGNATFLSIGQTSQLTAKVNWAQGVLTVTNSVAWTSADPAVATVSPSGVVTAIGFGTTTITGHLKDSDVTKRIDVLAATGLTVTASSVDGNILKSGVLSFTNIARTAQVNLVGTWPGGITRSVTADATWSSLDAAIASISSSGLLRSNAFGSTDVVAKYQSLTLSTKVEVTAVLTVLNILGNINLTAVGETSALTVSGSFTDGSNRNISSDVAWTTSNASVASVSPANILTAVGFGQASITASYLGKTRSVGVMVSPAGTFVISGRARDPGNGDGNGGGGVPGFAVRDLQTGASTATDAAGIYSLVGVVAGDRLRFEKDGWEPAELVIAKAGDASPGVQQIVRINSGGTVAITTAPNDLSYDLAPGISCTPCRLIRIVSPTAGTLHLRLTWTPSPAVRLSLFSEGHAFNPSNTSPFEAVADVTVGAGETVVYAGLIGGTFFSTGYLNLSLTTAFVAAAPSAVNVRGSRQE